MPSPNIEDPFGDLSQSITSLNVNPQIFANEILKKIASFCVELYTPTLARQDCGSILTSDVPKLINVRSASRIFNDGVKKGLRSAFSGEFELRGYIEDRNIECWAQQWNFQWMLDGTMTLWVSLPAHTTTDGRDQNDKEKEQCGCTAGRYSVILGDLIDGKYSIFWPTFQNLMMVHPFIPGHKGMGKPFKPSEDSTKVESLELSAGLIPANASQHEIECLMNEVRIVKSPYADCTLAIARRLSKQWRLRIYRGRSYAKDRGKLSDGFTWNNLIALSFYVELDGMIDHHLRSLADSRVF